ncbi:MAG TPA: TonB-dependent receptor [Candidatus Dormibacteraeota bacterium]|nr:TonB-dependent receptor [Candidatus Dormibacteraeota bacterium]
MRSLLHLGVLLLALPLAVPVPAQSNAGELRLKVTGPDNLPLKASVDLSSDALQFHRSFATDDSGQLSVRNLPFGRYRLQVHRESFSSYDGVLEIHSALPAEYIVKLSIAALSTAVNVTAGATLLDPERTTTINHLDAKAIADRPASLPGRSLPDLVDSQPGWLYEGNAVLHPRGSEYQTQFVVDGIPLTDNRSPGLGPELEADDVDSLTIYTAGIPAEYGRKMGGVIEVNTLRDIQPGFHGQAVLSGGSFDTAGAFASIQDSWGHNTVGASASGNMTARYLNPVVPENYTNRGTTGSFALSYERDITTKDRLTLSVRHQLSRYEIPNQLLQQFPDLQTPPGTTPQLQTAGNFETMGIVSYQHIFSPNVLANFRGMVRDNSADLNSSNAWPIAAFLHNDFKEGYFNAAISIHHGRHEWKAGLESDNLFLHENFSDIITANPNLLIDPYYPFDPGTPATFAFTGSRPDLEQSVYIQDLIHLGKWTVNAGLRWDHYQLVVNQNAASPRFSVARYFPVAGLIIHASYDRVFQTPSFENILLASSPSVTVLNPNVLRRPIEPSHGNYFELGASKSFVNQFRLDANYFRRYVNNFADDDQILNTAVSFPIAFRKAIIYGAEAKLELPHWKRFSGFLSYSYIVGNVWFPVTGGFLLGDDATNATQLTGHFPDSQDQRNTARARIRYQLTSRVWLAASSEYGSGLPFDFSGNINLAPAEYGQQVLDRINVAAGRIKPTFSFDLSAGADLYKKEKRTLHLQADAENLNNRLNVLDFAGLFSASAIAPPRSYFLRLATTF